MNCKSENEGFEGIHLPLQNWNVYWKQEMMKRIRSKRVDNR